MSIQLQLGLDTIRSYKRLSYTHWHAMAEFVDNSTQAYFNNRQMVDEQLKADGERLEVRVVFDRDSGLLRISDNSIGMSYDELQMALRVGSPPLDPSGRSKYGLGMKTAACWFGNEWSIRTKKLGETSEHTVFVDVESVAEGRNELEYSVHDNLPKERHYTVLEIMSLNREFPARTTGKIKDYLRSMYRQDIRESILSLWWQDSDLKWQDEDDFLKARDGSFFKKDFSFQVNEKVVKGWVGVLRRGGRPRAGFSILHAGRVVRGWPDSWRPELIFGQLQGSNDLVNQRLTGEIYLDDFEVTHTKDDILWLKDEEDEIQRRLRQECAEYRDVARRARRSEDDSRGPTDIEVQTALDEFQHELSSSEMADILKFEEVPPPDVIAEAVRPLKESVEARDVAFGGQVGSVFVKGYLASDTSRNDPYVIVEQSDPKRVIVIVNMIHPYISELEGSQGMLDYLRQCTYDAIAEWQATNRSTAPTSDTIKLLKDKLLRLPADIEMHQTSEIN